MWVSNGLGLKENGLKIKKNGLGVKIGGLEHCCLVTSSSPILI